MEGAHLTVGITILCGGKMLFPTVKKEKVSVTAILL